MYAATTSGDAGKGACATSDFPRLLRGRGRYSREVLSIEARALDRLLHIEHHSSTHQRVCPDTTPAINASKGWTSNDLRNAEPRTHHRIV
jgi:hypothetical protein